MSIELVDYAMRGEAGAAVTIAPDGRASQLAMRLVLLCYAEHANRCGEAWPAVATVGRETGLAVSTVRNALAGLRRQDLLVPVTGGKGGRSVTTRYVVMPNRGQPTSVPNSASPGAVTSVDETTIDKGALNGAETLANQRETFATHRDEPLPTTTDPPIGGGWADSTRRETAVLSSREAFAEIGSFLIPLLPEPIDARIVVSLWIDRRRTWSADALVAEISRDLPKRVRYLPGLIRSRLERLPEEPTDVSSSKDARLLLADRRSELKHRYHDGLLEHPWQSDFFDWVVDAEALLEEAKLLTFDEDGDPIRGFDDWSLQECGQAELVLDDVDRRRRAETERLGHRFVLNGMVCQMCGAHTPFAYSAKWCRECHASYHWDTNGTCCPDEAIRPQDLQ